MTVQFFNIPYTPILDLVQGPKPLDLRDCTQATHGSLMYSASFKPNYLGRGSFKVCLLGRLVLQPIPLSGLGSPGMEVVALKRPYMRKPSDDSSSQRYPALDELNLVSKEASAVQWGSALLAVVYSYLDAHPTDGFKNPPPTLQVRFVEAGVAKVIQPSAQATQALLGAYLVEERIPVEQGFVRFVGNGSAVPCYTGPNPHGQLLAQFCAFCQHVQWVLTGGQTYCSDWQGNPCFPSQI